MRPPYPTLPAALTPIQQHMSVIIELTVKLKWNENTRNIELHVASGDVTAAENDWFSYNEWMNEWI